MKIFAVVLISLIVFTFSALGQEMTSQKHPMDSTKVKKSMTHQRHMDSAKGVKYTCPMHPEVVKNKPGKCPKCGMTLVKVDAKINKQAAKKLDAVKPIMYVCPMHPDVTSDKPGKCPKCKMNLVKENEKKD